MKGRRVQLDTDPETGQPTVPWERLEPGDYCGPVIEPGRPPAVWMLLPNARDEGVPGWERGIRHIESPPHGFTEEPDGTLTVEGSILAVGPGGLNGWHGFLERGFWRQV